MRVPDAGCDRDISERAIAQVAMEPARVALVLLGRGVGLVDAVDSGEEVGLRGPAHVSAVEEVDPSVEVVVEPDGCSRPGVGTRGRAPGAPAGRRSRGIRATRHARPVRHLHEHASVVPKQEVWTVGRDVDVGVAIGVVIRHRRAHAVGWQVKAGRCCDVLPPPLALAFTDGVSVETHGWGSAAGRSPRPVVRVDEEEVGCAIGIEIEYGQPGSHGLGHELVAESARVVHEVDAALHGYVGENKLGRRGRTGPLRARGPRVRLLGGRAGPVGIRASGQEGPGEGGGRDEHGRVLTATRKRPSI